MPSGTKGFFFVVLVLMLSPSGLAQSTAPSSTSATGASTQTMQMTNIPYFTLRDGMDSVLTLNNLAPHPMVTNVTIFNMHGDARPLHTLTLAPHAITEIDLEQALSQLGDRERFDSGNVEISYTGQMMQVTAQVSIFSVDKRVDIESREQDMKDFTSTKQAGIVSLSGDAEGYLAITDVSPQPLTTTLFAGGDHEKDIKLQPRETQLIRLNDEFAGRAPAASLIRLQNQGLPGDIIATGFVLNSKTGYGSAFWMTDPASATSNVLAGVHFWAGKPNEKAGFPNGTYFHSPLLLANVSNATVTAHIFINYLQPSDPSSTSGQPAGKAPATPVQQLASQYVNVRDLTIPPGGVETYDLADPIGQAALADSDTNGFEVTYDAAPGSVIGHLTSYNASGGYSFEVPVRDPAGKDMTAGGGYPWTLQNGTDTTLHLMNTTDKATWAIVEFRFPDGTTYDPDRITMNPHQAVAIDIQKLRGSKQADIHQNVFPPSQDHGQLIWSEGTIHALIGRAEQVNVGDGFARSFSCGGECTCPDNLEFAYSTPSSITFYVGYENPGGYADYLAYAYYTDCNNFQSGPYELGGSTWSTTDSNIATAAPLNDWGLITAYNAGSTSAIDDSAAEQYLDDGMGDCTDNGSYEVQVGSLVNVSGGPQIMFGTCGGTNISNTTTSVVIGQRIALCAEGTFSSGVSASSYSWSLPGVTVAQYSASNSAGTLTTSVTTNQQTVTFYWPYPATSQVVTLTVNLNNGIQTSVRATFNIAAPSPDTPTVALPTSGSLHIDTLTGCTGISSAPNLVFGDLSGPMNGCPGPYTGSAGITVQPPSTSTPSGTFFFVQLITDDIVQYNNNITCTGSSGLDTKFPYENAYGQTVTDAPFMPLPSVYTSAGRQFDAVIYLMWQSSTSNSIPVPIGQVEWGFNAGATQSGGSWTPSGSGTANSFAAASATTDFPTWTNISACE